MITTTAHFATAHGAKYMQQLCKHLAHKVEVSVTETQAQATLPTGQAQFWADETGLRVEVVAEDIPSIIQARFVIDKHLATFAFRDHFAGFSWQIAS